MKIMRGFDRPPRRETSSSCRVFSQVTFAEQRHEHHRLVDVDCGPNRAQPLPPCARLP